MLKSKKVVNSEYHFIRCLGEGLSSTVYEAIRSNSSGIQNEKVAVKVLKSQNSVSWLRDEFESLRKVNSPYCVRVLGHEAFKEGPALILEFIEGVTLFELGSTFQLNENEIAHIGVQVKAGLAAIHSAKLAHGDLNPKNILLTRNGDVKLIDFGSFASSSELIGSIPYISNQVWNGDKPSFESDIASWRLIAQDLQSRFTQAPRNPEKARERARRLQKIDEVTSSKSDWRAELALKVEKLLSVNYAAISTSVLSGRKSEKSKFSAVTALMMLVFILFPAQNLLSEPLKAAEPAILLIRTHDWTAISINGVSKGYAPVNLSNLAPGSYRIKYMRPRGSGELTLHLNPGQKRLIRDADFKD